MGVGRELGLRGLPKCHRLGRDDVFERSALKPREDRLVNGLAILLFAQNAAAAWASEGLVGGERDDVGVLDGVWMRPAGNETGDMGRVEHQQSAHLIGDGPKWCRIDDS